MDSFLMYCEAAVCTAAVCELSLVRLVFLTKLDRQMFANVPARVSWDISAKRKESFDGLIRLIVAGNDASSDRFLSNRALRKSGNPLPL